MNDSGKPANTRWSALAPLREQTFRAIWSASVLANIGQLILGVGAAWEMTRLNAPASMVALVQAAMMLPLVLISVPAGAIADMFDRRKIALFALAFAALSAATLTVLSAAGLAAPWVMLAFCSLIGAGVALYSPAWQASVIEQVKAEHLPAAVALGSISYNLARSFGPAIGGLIVLALGATGAFAVNALFYLPLLAAFFFWRRESPPTRLPPERIDRAIVSGARYAIFAPPVRTAIVRAFAFGLASAAGAALPPLIARDLLQGDAGIYGLLLGASGVGAVAGALLSGRLRERLQAEQVMRLCAIVGALALACIGLSHNPLVTGALFLISGAANMVAITLLNVVVQLSAPRWVTARALAMFGSALAGGIALGAWFWGGVAGAWGVDSALIASGAALALTPLLGLLAPLPNVSLTEVQVVDFGGDPEVVLAVTNRSGPVVVEIDYRVDPEDARSFYNVMLRLQRVRQKNGAFDWSIARDLTDLSLWTERYHFPTWGDYLRHRSHFTEADREVQDAANAFHGESETPRVRRRLERPFGSVRWRAETLDRPQTPIGIYPP